MSHFVRSPKPIHSFQFQARYPPRPNIINHFSVHTFTTPFTDVLTIHLSKRTVLDDLGRLPRFFAAFLFPLRYDTVSSYTLRSPPLTDFGSTLGFTSVLGFTLVFDAVLRNLSLFASSLIAIAASSVYPNFLRCFSRDGPV